MFRRMNNSVLLLLLLLTGGGGAYLYHEHSSPEHMALVEAAKKLKDSQAEVLKERQQKEEEARQKEKFMGFVKRLEAKHGLAEIVVTDAVAPSAADPKGHETLLFTEVDANGVAVGNSVPFYIVGKRAYIEAKVIEFNSDEVKTGEQHSVAFFTRVLHDYNINELHGEAIPLQDEIPQSDLTADPNVNKAQKQMWGQFENYMNDPVLAAKNHVSVAQLQSAGRDFEIGYTYKVEIHNAAGIIITRTPLSAGVTNWLKSHPGTQPATGRAPIAPADH